MSVWNGSIMVGDWVAYTQVDDYNGGEVRIIGPAEFNTFIDGMDLVFEQGQAKHLAEIFSEISFQLMRVAR